MQDQPQATLLIEAVRQHLASQVLPTIAEPRLRFQTLVAANVLDIVVRELTLAEPFSAAEWARLADLLAVPGTMPANAAQRDAALAGLNAALCQAIEAGAFDEPAAWSRLLAHCQQTAIEKLQIANPAYLQRLQAEYKTKQPHPTLERL
ncbi:MAG: hypothetical protein H6666_10905 [Ardenticatenaceae bacterium]|nr:hypothetical protein [Anaerolineales bacterium]MCB8918427.1 hypothetical protein [Ardenticatenaceae bacterium]